MMKRRGYIVLPAVLGAIGLVGVPVEAQQGQRQGQHMSQQQFSQGSQGQSQGQQQSMSGAPLFASPAVVRTVQARLNQIGFDPGNVDGIWGQETESAVLNFQEVNNLDRTGNLDLHTLAALGLGGAIVGNDPQVAMISDRRLAQEVADSGGTQIYLSPALVRQAQQTLNSLGYDVGEVKGDWNNRTASALKQFQKANGLEPVGKFTFSTIQALGLSPSFVSLVNGQIPQSGIQTIGFGQSQDSSRKSGAPLYITPSEVRLAQQALSQSGYGVEEISGRIDRRTSESLKDFQRANNIEPTGKLTMATVNALGLGNTLLSGIVNAAQQGGVMQPGFQQRVQGQQLASAQGSFIPGQQPIVGQHQYGVSGQVQPQIPQQQSMRAQFGTPQGQFGAQGQFGVGQQMNPVEGQQQLRGPVSGQFQPEMQRNQFGGQQFGNAQQRGGIPQQQFGGQQYIPNQGMQGQQ